ncbi:unnamed protein product [Periconia digitata]|uniref:Uncharacterized protein n=1 Tax=Periconia digitata TaxID=1303443 RepID=A0A9W4UXH1_9PLEO|nr:unnamed protein product [Periconia digitata]
MDVWAPFRDARSLAWIFPPITAAAYLYMRSEERSEEELKAPTITANIRSGFCGYNEVLISRLPIGHSQSASWQTLLRLLHETDASIQVHGNLLESSKQSWTTLPKDNLAREGGVSGTKISRATLLALFALSNARIIYEYPAATGYRAALGSWIGQWYINWPAGGQAVVILKAHDSHAPNSDVYPPTFAARVDRCIRMMAGVAVDASHPTDLNVGFPGRQPVGDYHLEFQDKGFGLSHGSRHLYNMCGGKVFEMDFLLARKLVNTENLGGESWIFTPSLEGKQDTRFSISRDVKNVIAHAMDCLPWSNLSWSVHRGMRDILLAFTRHTMNKYRPALARQLRNTSNTSYQSLVDLGWEKNFVKNYMGRMAESTVLAGRGNSGDAIRIITALAEQAHTIPIEQRDETRFWRREEHYPAPIPAELDSDTTTALVKCVVLEWSVDFNYQMYHQLPLSLVLS